MSRLTINSNIASINAQRNFTNATKKLTESYTRLSSGLRINKAGDDAAGLSVSAKLNFDAKIYSSALRNANDFLSATSIAESALSEITKILERLDELATQAQNGTNTFKQRTSLNKEAQALTSEANRIVKTTSFNGINLLANPELLGDIALGYGSQEVYDTNLGDAFQRNVSDGTISIVNSVNGPNYQGGSGLSLGDFNNDGNIDMVSGQSIGYHTALNFGNGDGSFASAIQFSPGPFTSQYQISSTYLESFDINNDGNLDLLIGGNNAAGESGVWLQYGNGNGTFKTSQLVAQTTSTINNFHLSDINNDGVQDLITNNSSAGTDVQTFIGTSSGTFISVGIVSGGLAGNGEVVAGDFNGDGVKDIFITDHASGSGRVAIGNGNGSFRASTAVTLNSGVFVNAGVGLDTGDLNGDGNLDIVFASSGNSLAGILGDGSGSFGSSFEIYNSSARTSDVRLIDFNGDNILDIVTGRDYGGVNLHIGNGNGTFSMKSSTLGTATAQFASIVDAADFNKDGALDFVTNTYPLTTEALKVFVSNTTKSSLIETIDLTTLSSAREASSIIDTIRQRVQNEKVNIGALESRISTGISVLSARVNGFKEAASQITDADIAEESSKLTANQIVQQAAASVLAQANLQPRLVLDLLNDL